MRMKLALSFLLVCFLLIVAYLVIQEILPRTAGTFWQSLAFVSSAILVGLLAAIVISDSFTRPLKELASASTVISRGDLTRTVPINSQDEVGELARSFNRMSTSLLQVLTEVRKVGEQVFDSAQSFSSTTQEMHQTTGNILSAVQEIAHGAEEQAAMVAQSSEITRQLADSIRGIAEKAKLATLTAGEARAKAEQGGAFATIAAERISQMSDTITEAKKSVEGFDQKASGINHAVESIQSIAQQTHLLALNAAIEAARAGEQGKGFAVVADEVRKLSEDVRCLAGEIASMAKEINGGAGEVLRAMTSSVTAARDGQEVVTSASRALSAILASILSTVGRVEEISALTEQQKEASEELVRNTDHIAEIARTNAAGTQEASTATEVQNASMKQISRSAKSLARSSDSLKDLISLFRVA